MNETPRFCIIAKGKTLCKCSNLDKDDNCKLQKGKYSSYSAQYCGCPLKHRGGDVMNEEPINNEYQNRPSCWNCMHVFIHSEQDGTKEFHCAIQEKEPRVEPSRVCGDWE